MLDVALFSEGARGLWGLTSFLKKGWNSVSSAASSSTKATSLQAAKTGTQITKHAAERMVERGITQKMVETGISKGTKYLDPKNGTFNYVLKTVLLQGRIC